RRDRAPGAGRLPRFASGGSAAAGRRQAVKAMSRFFIDRPIFAWVIAIVIMLAGALSIAFLPVAQYPDIAPPQVNISANYPGASPETAENSVTQVIEQQLTGLDGLIYFSSTSDANGGIGISGVFRAGVNPDIAQVQV